MMEVTSISVCMTALEKMHRERKYVRTVRKPEKWVYLQPFTLLNNCLFSSIFWPLQEL